MSQAITKAGLGLCVLMLLCGVALAQDNLVVNGSFETPLAESVAWPGYFVGVADIDGWSANGNFGLNNNRTDSADDGQRNPFHGGGRPIPDGNQVLFIQPPDSSGAVYRLQQIINGMEDGEWYRIIFYTAIRPGRDPMEVRLEFGGNNVELIPWTLVTNNGADEPYVRFEHLFQYRSTDFTTTRLRIQTRLPEGEEYDSTILFDHVQMYRVPLSVSVSGTALVTANNDVVLTAQAIAAGDTATYQWFRNGVELVGETQSTLTLPNVVVDDTAIYSVTVTDGDRVATASFNLSVAPYLPVSGVPGLAILLGTVLLAGAGLLRYRYVRT